MVSLSDTDNIYNECKWEAIYACLIHNVMMNVCNTHGSKRIMGYAKFSVFFIEGVYNDVVN